MSSTATPNSKRSSLSINVMSSSSGPRPLQLLNTATATTSSPSVSSQPPLNSPPLPTPPPTSSNRRHGSNRRQSSISYNPPPQPTRRASSVARTTATATSPTTSSPPLPLGSPREETAPRREPTLMEMHSSLLAQIAQREERSLELKAMLKTNEDELVQLKRKWAQLISSTTPISSPVTTTSPAGGSRHQEPMPNIADPFYGISSPTFDGLIREGAKGVSRFLSSFAVPPTPQGHLQSVTPSMKRRASRGRENRDSASSSGSGTTAESVDTAPTSVEDEDEKPLIDFGDDEARTTSLSRNNSSSAGAARRRSRQLVIESSSSSSSSLSSPTVTRRADKRNTISTPISSSSPGLGLAGVVGSLFAGNDGPEDRSPLTLKPKRHSSSASISNATPNDSKRRSASILGGFNWNDMLATSNGNSRAVSPACEDDSDPNQKERRTGKTANGKSGGTDLFDEGFSW